MLNILCHPWFLMTEEEIEVSVAEKKLRTTKKRKYSKALEEEEKKVDPSDPLSTADLR